jgi:hypothetical protein
MLTLESDSTPPTLAVERPRKQPRRCFRFSLRILFLITTVAAFLSYWMMAPTLKAKQFVQALNAGNFEAADDGFCNQEDRFLLELYEKHWRCIAWADLQPWTFAQLLRGDREITLHVGYGDAGPMRSFTFNVIVTGAGLLAPEQVFRGSSSGMVIAHSLIPRPSFR